VDAADAFVGVASRDDEARDLGVDFAAVVGKEVGRQFCAMLARTASVGAWYALLLTPMRRLDRLSQCGGCPLSCLVISARCQRLVAMATASWSSL
jgi:hypothetical protein